MDVLLQVDGSVCDVSEVLSVTRRIKIDCLSRRKKKQKTWEE